MKTITEEERYWREHHRARCNGFAVEGKYSEQIEGATG